jgi:hypothetical protein
MATVMMMMMTGMVNKYNVQKQSFAILMCELFEGRQLSTGNDNSSILYEFPLARKAKTVLKVDILLERINVNEQG